MSRTKVTKAEALARFHDKYAGWGDLRNHEMQKAAAEMLRKQEELLALCLSELPGHKIETIALIEQHLQETEDAK